MAILGLLAVACRRELNPVTAAPRSPLGPVGGSAGIWYNPRGRVSPCGWSHGVGLCPTRGDTPREIGLYPTLAVIAQKVGLCPTSRPSALPVPPFGPSTRAFHCACQQIRFRPTVRPPIGGRSGRASARRSRDDPSGRRERAQSRARLLDHGLQLGIAPTPQPDDAPIHPCRRLRPSARGRQIPREQPRSTQPWLPAVRRADTVSEGTLGEQSFDLGQTRLGSGRVSHREVMLGQLYAFGTNARNAHHARSQRQHRVHPRKPPPRASRVPRREKLSESWLGARGCRRPVAEYRLEPRTLLSQTG
jgi:hypothetical protein